MPPFNSLDRANGLPLGSLIITDLTQLSSTIGGLDSVIPYYVRVSVANAIGQGAFGYPKVAYVKPRAVLPSPPANATVTATDGRTLGVTFAPPN